MVGLFAREMHRLSDGWNIENETEEIPRNVLRLHPQHRGEWRCHLLRWGSWVKQWWAVGRREDEKFSVKDLSLLLRVCSEEWWKRCLPFSLAPMVPPPFLLLLYTTVLWQHALEQGALSKCYGSWDFRPGEQRSHSAFQTGHWLWKARGFILIWGVSFALLRPQDASTSWLWAVLSEIFSCHAYERRMVSFPALKAIAWTRGPQSGISTRPQRRRTTGPGTLPAHVVSLGELENTSLGRCHPQAHDFEGGQYLWKWRKCVSFRGGVAPCSAALGHWKQAKHSRTVVPYFVPAYRSF